MNYTYLQRDKDDANFGFALSELDNYSQRFVWSSSQARTQAFRKVLNHCQQIVSYLRATDQIAENETNAETIKTAWQFRRIDKPDPKRFHLFQPSDKAGHFEFRSLIDGTTFPYPAADVAAMRAAREAVEAWNASILDELVAKRWLQPHGLFDVAKVASVYKQATRGN